MRKISLLLILTLAAAASPVQSAQSQYLVTFIVVGNYAEVLDDCNEHEIWGTGMDFRAWPTDGAYQCPNGGPSGFVGANPSPLLVGGGVRCVATARACTPMFSNDLVQGSDATSAFADAWVIPRDLGSSGCYDVGVTYFRTRTNSNVYNTSAQCSTGGGEGGGVPEAGYVGSPIIIDTSHNGYRLTSLGNGVWFDLTGDGIAEQVSWTAAGSDESFLALDRNGNGRVDSGAELFGNYTPPLLANGFEALKVFDSDNNGVIDEADPVFAQLLLWTDRNHDGFSQASELRPLNASMLAIHLRYKISNRQDRHGNLFRQRAKAVWPDREAYIYDVWLKMQ